MINIPKRFEDAALSDFPEDSMLRAAGVKYIAGFEEFFEQGMAPVFLGRPGTGKSRISAAILNTVFEKTTPQVSVGWFPASESINRLLDFRDMRLNDSYATLWTAMRSTQLVVFDDISTIRTSPRVLEYFWMIVDARYSELLPTIFTANFEQSLDDKSPWDVMADYFNPAFARRLRETSLGLAVLV